jgi:drug/metabolite transporter (DMT)-like permease
VNAAAIFVAFLDAIAFGSSTALMHHSASRAPESPGGARGLAVLIRHLATQKTWLAGVAASLTGLGLHSVALALGSLAVVQPIVVTGLVFAFVFRAVLDRKMPQPRVMLWVVVVAAGIAIFLVGAHTNESSDDVSVGTAFGFVAVAGALAAVTWWLATKATEIRAGLMMGVAGGLIFGMIASMIKVVTSSSSLWEALTTWPIYALAGLGLAGFLSNQYAYNRAPLSQSLPVLNVVNPVIAVTFGIVVFNESPSSDPALLTLEVIGLLTVLTGVAFLAREEDDKPGDGPRAAGEPDEGTLPPPSNHQNRTDRTAVDPLAS